MINRDDILSLEFLKKTEFTGSTECMRYRLQMVKRDEEKVLLAIVWPEPYNYVKTPEDQKQSAEFTFDNDGIADAVAWMNDRLFEMKK